MWVWEHVYVPQPSAVRIAAEGPLAAACTFQVYCSYVIPSYCHKAALQYYRGVYRDKQAYTILPELEPALATSRNLPPSKQHPRTAPGSFPKTIGFLRSSRYIRLCFASPVRPFPNSASCLCTLYAHAACGCGCGCRWTWELCFLVSK